MNIAVVIRDNVTRLMEQRGFKSQTQFAKAVGVAQRTINKLYLPDATPPSLVTVVAISDGLKLEPWMLLVPDFPWDKLTRENVKTITPHGYTLIKNYEFSGPSTQQAILMQMAWLLENNEKNSKGSDQVKEATMQFKTSLIDGPRRGD